MENKTLIELTAQIVTAAAGSKEMSKDELLAAISDVHAALKRLQNPEVTSDNTAPLPAEPALKPLASIKKNEVVCLICGKDGFKTLSRHLKQTHGMTPSEYKKQFGLKSSVKLVAKAYSEKRREAAKALNLAGNLEKARAARKQKKQVVVTKPVVAKKATPKTTSRKRVAKTK